MFSVKNNGSLSLLLLVTSLALPCVGLTAKTCPVGVPVGTFKITVLPAKGGPAIPLSEINVISPGEKLRYEPVKVAKGADDKTRISLILVPAVENGEKHLAVLPPQEIGKPAEWTVWERVSAAGVIFGPHGVDTKKVEALVQKHPEIVSKLADYAEQSSRVEAMVQTLTDYESSAPGSVGLQSVMQGFSSQYGVAVTVDASAASSQQALTLMRALAPTVAKNDPLGSDLMSKTGTLAGSLAASYFGTPVALAIGGAELASSLRTSIFPPTDFRSAFAEQAGDGTSLCTAKVADSKTKVRLDYLWISRVPNEDPPPVSLLSEDHIPLGVSSTVTVKTKTVGQLKDLTRAHDWQLVETGHEAAIPVKVEVGAKDDKLTLDLSHAKLPAGEYQLAAKWDWTPMTAAGKIDVLPFGNMADVKLTPDSQDALISGTGDVPLQLTGTDFEFVDSMSLVPAEGKQAKRAVPVPVSFTLPKGKAEGEQTTVEADLDTSALHAGRYLLAVKQSNGTTENVAMSVHPPNPEIAPDIRVNVGEPQQTVELRGKELDRIEKITSDNATWTLQPVPKGAQDETSRSATVKLNAKAQKGDQIAANVFVTDLQKPLQVADLLSVAGPRPKIVSASKSLATLAGIELRDGEVPAGQAASFAMQVENLGSRPTLDLACQSDGATRHKIVLAPGDKDGAAQLDITGEDTLFLSVDPGAVGDSGCKLMAQVTDPSTGTSDSFLLGQVIRLPHIDKLSISDQRLSDSTYAGTLTGENLQLIAKAGWTTKSGDAVQGIPTENPSNPRQQTLKIAVPWPPPSPQAPLYVWLRGESQARLTDARY